jgi:hypothetical protein
MRSNAMHEHVAMRGDEPHLHWYFAPNLALDAAVCLTSVAATAAVIRIVRSCCSCVV